MKWKIGCSGFSYNEWSEFFYPVDLPTSKWFEYYTKHFDTVELNVTFYRFPALSFLKNLYNRSPGNFCFIVKAPKLITHTHRFKDVKELLNEFYTVINNGLKEKLGAILFQLPPGFKYSDEHMEIILKSLNKTFTNVIEFRNESWWNESIYAELSKHKITFCGVSYPGLPDDIILNTATPYYRFHGVPKLYYSMYKNSFLNTVGDTFLKSKNIDKAFMLFNNTATRAALENASHLQEYFTL